MSDLRDLYQEVILDHSKRPRNYRTMDDASHQAKGYNPLCGDKVDIFLRCEDGIVKDVSFQGSGCAISTASASMLTEYLRGMTLDEVQAAFASFHGMLTGDSDAPDSESMGKLAVFSGVGEFPARVKCATLAWHTLQSAMNSGAGEMVTTE